MMIYGPVPSRRFGRSLGINNIFVKYCSYSCVYCQVGRTKNMAIKRRKFYNPDEIFKNAEETIQKLDEKNEYFDFITFVSHGEPTLDVNLGCEIDLLKSFGYKIAVITNSSLITDKEVRRDLAKADYVSVKVDTVSENIWRKINRPHKDLNLEKILDGILVFSDIYKGCLFTETMILDSINDSCDEFEKVSSFIKKISPEKSYISVPMRPPAEKLVKPPTKNKLNISYQTFKSKNIDVEFLISSEGDDFGSIGDVKNDILSITSVHPMTKESIEEFLKKSGSDWKVIDDLLKKELLKELEFNGKKFYIRNFYKNIIN